MLTLYHAPNSRSSRSVEQYDSLLARVPPVDDDPAIAILRGRDSA